MKNAYALDADEKWSRTIVIWCVFTELLQLKVQKSAEKLKKLNYKSAKIVW